MATHNLLRNDLSQQIDNIVINDDILIYPLVVPRILVVMLS